MQCGPPPPPVSYHNDRIHKELTHNNVKYVQPVKVVPDGPPVPAVLIGKGHGVTRNDYSAPSYTAPKPVYQAPKPTYEKPRYDGYGAPKANDAAPTSYSPPKPTYDAPRPGYNAPAPSSGYQSGLDSYSAPKPTYDAPSSEYGAPKPTYNAPSSSYGVPKAPSYAPSYSKSDSVGGQLGIKRESVGHGGHHNHAPLGHSHGGGHDHAHSHNHGNGQGLQHSHNHNHGHGHSHGLGHNHGGGQDNEQGQRQGRLEECVCMPAGQCPSQSVMGFGFGGHRPQQQHAPLRKDVTPLQDYSGLIDPRIKATSDIVAAGEHDEDDTIDLDEVIDDKIDSNRAR